MRFKCLREAKESRERKRNRESKLWRNLFETYVWQSRLFEMEKLSKEFEADHMGRRRNDLQEFLKNKRNTLSRISFYTKGLKSLSNLTEILKSPKQKVQKKEPHQFQNRAEFVWLDLGTMQKAIKIPFLRPSHTSNLKVLRDEFQKQRMTTSGNKST